jgi:uncharacterized protein (DUF169 family)
MIDAVGIAVLDHLPLGVNHVLSPGRHCTFVGQARQGLAAWASDEDITCPLARFNLGLDTPDPETVARLSRTLVEWKAAKDVETGSRFLSQLVRLPFGRRVFVYGPLADIPFPVDLVVRIVRPEEAMARLRDLAAATGELAQGRSGGIGALCGDCTAAVLVTGRPVLSPGCPGSRREAFLSEAELFLSFPQAFERAAL